jgi:hypothetical protein
VIFKWLEFEYWRWLELTQDHVHLSSGDGGIEPLSSGTTAVGERSNHKFVSQVSRYLSDQS